MIAIIDYGIGNLQSVYNAFISEGFDAIVTSDKDLILNSDKVVLPGVGAFKDAIDTIKEKGFDEIIKKIVEMKKPILGICVGMQVLFEGSYEYGYNKGLGILKGEIVPFKGSIDESLKIPHMGWNNLEIAKESKLFNGLDNPYVYFVHSYYLDNTDSEIISAYTNYGKKIIVAIEKDNIYATQFHPEKSGNVGMQIIRNFGNLC